MTEHTIRTYTATELREQFPEAFKVAFTNWSESQTETPWSDEIVDSLKKLIEAAGLRLVDWNLGAYNRSNYIKVSFGGNDDVENLSGPRAIAWIENNLLADLRVPFTGAERWKLSRFGRAYRAGSVKPCPFTGFFADDDYLEALLQEVRSGETLKDAFTGLADVAMRLMEAELEGMDEDYFTEEAEANGYEFTETGKRFN